MFNIINPKKIYEQLRVDSKELINLIVKNGYKDEFITDKAKDWNCFLVYYHLLSIVYIKIKFKKGNNKAEKVAKKLVYESAIRLPNNFPINIVVDVSSNIITKFVSTYKCSINSKDISFSNELANSICNIISKEKLHSSKNNYDKLINELTKYIEDKMFEYDILIK